MEPLETDVLIIGSGGAGLRAAIEARDQGARVLVISKSLHRKAHTVMAEGGVAAALGNLDAQDTWKVHAQDTYEEGVFIGNTAMIMMLAKQGPERVLELDNWGASFDRTEEGKIMQRPFGAHTYRRVCHVGDRTGLEIIQTLADQARKREVQYLEEYVITALFASKGAIAGAAAIDMKTGEFSIIKAKTIILATGGYGRIYKRTSNPWESTGDGCGLAYALGVPLQDMEMVQFHPTGMIYPESAEGLLVTESVRGEGGILLNAKGERFMDKYDPKRMELGPRDVVARANYSEIQAGNGTPHGGVWLDITHKGAAYITFKLPKMVQQFKDFAGVDITKEKMEVAPTCHYTMGGIAVHPETGMTAVKGLFAAGETAAGVHGANRLGGNSLTDILVFGRIAGLAAAQYAARLKTIPLIPQQEITAERVRLEQPFKQTDRTDGVNPALLKEKVREIMWKYVGIVREESELLRGLEEIERIKKETDRISISGTFHYNPSFNDFLDLDPMLICAEATIRAALLRKESRGAHYRRDYPGYNDTGFLCNILCRKGKRGMELEKNVLPRGKPDWEKLVEA